MTQRPPGLNPCSIPMWESISTIFSMLLGSMRGDVILFSTARQTPSEVWIPMAVEPSCKTQHTQTSGPILTYLQVCWFEFSCITHTQTHSGFVWWVLKFIP